MYVIREENEITFFARAQIPYEDNIVLIMPSGTLYVIICHEGEK